MRRRLSFPTPPPLPCLRPSFVFTLERNTYCKSQRGAATHLAALVESLLLVGSPRQSDCKQTRVVSLWRGGGGAVCGDRVLGQRVVVETQFVSTVHANTFGRGFKAELPAPSLADKPNYGPSYDETIGATLTSVVKHSHINKGWRTGRRFLSRYKNEAKMSGRRLLPSRSGGSASSSHPQVVPSNRVPSSAVNHGILLCAHFKKTHLI